MPAPAAVSELVARCHAHLTTYKQSAYNEEQLRIEFLNPLFKALGWDMDNVQGARPSPPSRDGALIFVAHAH